MINSSGDTYSPVFLFDTGNAEFRTEAGVLGTDYEKLYARKFTFVPYGGFDGWDIYRTRRSNLDSFIVNGSNGQKGLTSEIFRYRTLTNGDIGINSDYYAYLEAIWTFRNPEAVNINVFATPGIDNDYNSNLIEATIDMVEQDRADSLYIMTTPDTDLSGDALTTEDVADRLDGMYDIFGLPRPALHKIYVVLFFCTPHAQCGRQGCTRRRRHHQPRRARCGSCAYFTEASERLCDRS